MFIYVFVKMNLIRQKSESQKSPKSQKVKKEKQSV